MTTPRLAVPNVVKLTAKQHALLYEALGYLERAMTADLWQAALAPGSKIDLTVFWVGYGPPSTFAPVVDAGLMQAAAPVLPGIWGWHQLTKLGARVVCAWRAEGYSYTAPGEEGAPPRVVHLEMTR